jgi:hypothetical protein
MDWPNSAGAVEFGHRSCYSPPGTGKIEAAAYFPPLRLYAIFMGLLRPLQDWPIILFGCGQARLGHCLNAFEVR